MIARRQLLALGFTPRAIEHRIRTGRLHVIWRGVYAVGRPEVSELGRWMAAVLACGEDAFVSHRSAAELWRMLPPAGRDIHVSVIAGFDRRLPGIRVHRRLTLSPADVTVHEGVPLTAPICTLIDIATDARRPELEAAVNEADKLDLVDPEAVRAALDTASGRRGVRRLRTLLDRATFALTDSELERRFLPIARRAGLARPQTQAGVNGYRVDFYWPELGLIVETDGLRYHRTATQQARDRVRDQTLTAAGLTVLRITHAQVRFEPGHVGAVLGTTARRLLN